MAGAATRTTVVDSVGIVLLSSSRGLSGSGAGCPDIGDLYIGGGRDGPRASGLPGFVSVINKSTNQVVANVGAGAFPSFGIAVNPVTNKVYVGGTSDGSTFPSP